MPRAMARCQHRGTPATPHHCAGGREVRHMKKITVRKAGAIKLTSVIIGPGYAAC
jgi:hypothetical protein